MSLPRRALLVLVPLALLPAGALGWRAWSRHDVHARVTAIQVLTEQGQGEEALEASRDLARAWPHRIEGPLLAGTLHAARWERKEAGQAWMTAYRVQPEDFPDLPGLAFALGMSETPALQVLDLLDAHEARFPDAPGLAEARVVALTELLNLEDTPEADRVRYREALARHLESVEALGPGPVTRLYHVAEAHLLLDQAGKAREAMEAGLGAPGDAWDRLILHMGLAFVVLHGGDEARARTLFSSYTANWLQWPGYHFAMRMPMLQFLEAVTRVRWGTPLPIPPQARSRAAAARAAGVKVQYGVEDTVARLDALFAAMDQGDDEAVLQGISDVLTLLARDQGCVVETRLVKPTVTAHLLWHKARLLERGGQPQAAEEARQAAREACPQDPWFRSKAEGEPR